MGNKHNKIHHGVIRTMSPIDRSNESLNIGQVIENAEKLKFKINYAELLIGNLSDLILTKLYCRKKQTEESFQNSKKTDRSFNDLVKAHESCKTVKQKILFNKAVDHFVCERTLNPAKYL